MPPRAASRGSPTPKTPNASPAKASPRAPPRPAPATGRSPTPRRASPALDSPPSLSADGYTVAFLTGSGLRPNTLKADALDLFLTSMAPGVTRKAGTRELTLAVNGAQGDGNAPITSLALSADGSRIAFVSQRNAFVLSEPAPTGSFSQLAQQSELYVIDLPANTLERAVLGLEGVEQNGSTLADPTLTEDGSTLAFVSEASNLIFGDANGFSDAFTATLQAPAGTAAPPAGVNAGVGGFSLSGVSSPELGVSVKRGKDGGVILLVETPGPGKLTVQARGSIPKAASAKAAKKARASSAVAGASKTKRAAKQKATAKQKSPPAVLLAGASAAAPSEGTTTLTLQLSSKYAADLRVRASSRPTSLSTSRRRPLLNRRSPTKSRRRLSLPHRRTSPPVRARGRRRRGESDARRRRGPVDFSLLPPCY